MIIYGIFHYNPLKSILEILYINNLEWIVLIVSQMYILFFYVWIKIFNLYFKVIVILKPVFL